MTIAGGIAVAPPVRMSSSDIVEWTLGKENAHVICVRRQTPNGFEICVTFGGLLVSRSLRATAHAAGELTVTIRQMWEAAGWLPRAAEVALTPGT